MQWRNTGDRYGLVAQTLHWLIAVGIVAQYLLAEAEQKDVHAALGITVLALAVVRLAWRCIELPPDRPLAMKSYEMKLARVVHSAFYVLLFAVPLTGWALATMDGREVSFFGWFNLPQLLPVTLSKDALEELHEVLFNVLAGLAALHIAAALKHQFVDRDNVLRSMLPMPSSERTSARRRR